MKCLCGYEQEDDFKHYIEKETILPAIDVPYSVKVVKEHLFKNMYVCPKCGTLQTKVEDND